jgi:hypothetical protein
MKAILVLHLKEFLKVKYFIVLIFVLSFNIIFSLGSNKIVNIGFIVYIFFLIVISDRYNGLKKIILTTGRDRREYFLSKFYLSVIFVFVSIIFSIAFEGIQLLIFSKAKELIDVSNQFTYMVFIKQLSIYLIVWLFFIISENASNKTNIIILLIGIFLIFGIKMFHLEFLLNMNIYFKNLNISFIIPILLLIVNCFVFKHSKIRFMKEDFYID